MCHNDVLKVYLVDGARVCDSCSAIVDGDRVRKVRKGKYTEKEIFTQLSKSVISKISKLIGPRLFDCTLTRDSGRGGPPVRADQLAWDMIIWAIRAHFQNAVFGSIIRAYTSNMQHD